MLRRNRFLLRISLQTQVLSRWENISFDLVVRWIYIIPNFSLIQYKLESPSHMFCYLFVSDMGKHILRSNQQCIAFERNNRRGIKEMCSTMMLLFKFFNKLWCIHVVQSSPVVLKMQEDHYQIRKNCFYKVMVLGVEENTNSRHDSRSRCWHGKVNRDIRINGPLNPIICYLPLL